MLLSVSRAITLIFLRYQVKKKSLLAAFLSYTFFLLGWHIIAHIFGGPDTWYGYRPHDAHCFIILYNEPLSFIDQFIRASSIGIPPVVTAISFIVVTCHLLQHSIVSNSDKIKRRAVVTMAMFTALFLVCNLPCLLNSIMWFVTLLFYTYPEPIYTHPFMAYYSWLISDVVCTVLNAALNPVLYFCRMAQLREWISATVFQRT